MNTGGKFSLPGFLPRVHVDDVLLQTRPLFPVQYYHKRRSARGVYRDSVLLWRGCAAGCLDKEKKKTHSECWLKAGIYIWFSWTGNKSANFKKKYNIHDRIFNKEKTDSKMMSSQYHS